VNYIHSLAGGRINPVQGYENTGREQLSIDYHYRLTDRPGRVTPVFKNRRTVPADSRGGMNNAVQQNVPSKVLLQILIVC
jgi:hypothetical protein